jgi:hypothetical protein
MTTVSLHTLSITLVATSLLSYSFLLFHKTTLPAAEGAHVRVPRPSSSPAQPNTSSQPNMSSESFAALRKTSGDELAGLAEEHFKHE